MTSTEAEFDIRKILVALDNSSHAASALEAAASLAARLHADLEGVFVEDVNLSRLAALPVGREIQLLTGQARDFTAASLEAQNKEQEQRARWAIAQAAARARVTYAFRVARGQVDVEIISAASRADLLILGFGRQSLGGRWRLGSTARAAAESAPHSVLISKPGIQSIGVPLVAYDGTRGSRRALQAATRLSGVPDRGIVVLILAEDLDQAAHLREEVDAQCVALPVRPRFLHSAHPSPGQMCRFATESGADILVLSADCALLAGADKLAILEQIACPVLLVR